MFTPDERDRLRRLLLTRAEFDDSVTGAAFTGSSAAGTADRWSDTDLVLAVRGDLAPVIARWTRWLADEQGALHHWDLPVGAGTVRVFLLPHWLEVDLTFAPEPDFGPRGPHWHTVFGDPRPQRPFRAPDPAALVGLLWHHALHIRICLARGRWWQAEHWIAAIRDHALTLACLRLGLPADHAKGAHLLPDEVTAPLAATLVRSLDPAELERAFRAALVVAADAIEGADPGAAVRLGAALGELAEASG